MYITNTEEILEAQNGNDEKFADIIERNNGLIWSIVKRFIGRGYEAEDLYQIGCMGFIKAIKRFDAGYEVKISTYAVPYILGEIKRFIRDDGPIKVSRSIKETAIKIRELQKEYINKNGEEISLNEISKKLKISKEEIAMALDSSNPIESINEEKYSDDENGMNKIELLTNGEDEAENLINKLALKELIERLDKREKEIILLRYFKNRTQTEVAKILDITQVQVSRIEKKILLSMREKIG